TGAPRSAADVTEAAMVMLYRLRAEAEADKLWGVYHVTAAGKTSWYEYASYIVRRAAEYGAILKLAGENIVAVSSAEYGAAATRPMSSLLCSEKAGAAFGVSMRDWTHGVD